MEETKRCPYCGEEILATAVKCKHCKSWLGEKPKATVPCPICGESIVPDTDVCPHCKEKTGFSHTEEVAQVPPAEPAYTNDMGDTEPAPFFEYYLAEPWAGNKEERSNVIFPAFNFGGIISRRQAIVAGVVQWVVFTAILCIFYSLAISGSLWWFAPMALFYLLWLAKGVELSVRRLRDTNSSPWLVLLALVPIANLFNIVLMFKKGSASRRTQWTAKDSLIALVITVMFVGAIAMAINAGSNLVGRFGGNSVTAVDSLSTDSLGSYVEPESDSDEINSTSLTDSDVEEISAIINIIYQKIKENAIDMERHPYSDEEAIATYGSDELKKIDKRANRVAGLAHDVEESIPEGWYEQDLFFASQDPAGETWKIEEISGNNKIAIAYIRTFSESESRGEILTHIKLTFVKESDKWRLDDVYDDYYGNYKENMRRFAEKWEAYEREQ